MKLPRLFVLFILVLAFSCRKDDPNPVVINADGEVVTPPDTVESNDYFPTYPGSYWIYDTGDTAYINSEYVLAAHYDYYKPYWWYYTEDIPGHIMRYTPYYHGGFKSGLVKDYTFYPSGYNGSPYRIFSENSTWWDGRVYSDIYENMTVTKRDSMMSVLGEMMPVTIVRWSAEGGPVNPEYSSNPEYWGVYRYYAKDVGLYKWHSRSYEDSTEITVELVNYFIND